MPLKKNSGICSSPAAAMEAEKSAGKISLMVNWWERKMIPGVKFQIGLSLNTNPWVCRAVIKPQHVLQRNGEQTSNWQNLIEHNFKENYYKPAIPFLHFPPCFVKLVLLQWRYTGCGCASPCVCLGCEKTIQPISYDTKQDKIRMKKDGKRHHVALEGQGEKPRSTRL